MKKILNKFHQGTLTTVIIIIIFGNISSGVSLKQKMAQLFQVSSYFHPYRHPLQQTTEISAAI